jgi:DNA-binding response OmpR family regulator
LHRTRGIRTERDRTRRRRLRVGERRAAEILILGELGTRFRDDPRSPASRSTGEPRILIVDDESAIRLVCRVNLDSAGFETIEAEDGETALALARSERPDLILLDVMLPGLDGWEVAAKLREMPETRDIPIVFLTARSAAPDEVRGHEVGGLGFIAKPFDPAELSQTVTATLRRVRRGERDQMRREWGQSIPRD